MQNSFSCVISSTNVSKPKFRIWLNDKMLLEQTYICSNEYEVLYETCVLTLLPGTYVIRVESLSENTDFSISRIKVNDVLVGSSFTI